MKDSRLIIVLALVFSLFISSSVPVSAAATSSDSTEFYIPSPPEFLAVDGNGVKLKAPLNTSSDTVKSFFTDYYKNPYVTLVAEDKYNNSWWLYFVKLNVPLSKSFSFEVYHTKDFPDRNAPIRLNNGTDVISDCLFYQYSNTEKKFTSSGSTKQITNYLDFSFVIDSSALSSSISSYPYYSKLGGVKFSAASATATKPSYVSFYNWWIGKKRTSESDNQGQIKPPLGVDPDAPTSSGGGSSSSSPTSSGGGGSSSSNPTSSGGGSSSSSPTSSGGGGSSSSDPTSSGGGIRVPKIYFHSVLRGDSNKVDIIPPLVKNLIFISINDPQTIYEYLSPDIPGYKKYGNHNLKVGINYFFENDPDRHFYFYYENTSEPPVSSNPTSSDTSSESPNPDDPNKDLVTFTIRYFSRSSDGTKTPLTANFPHTYKKITAQNNTQFTYTPPYVKGYTPLQKQYTWLVQDGREVEVIYAPGSSGGNDDNSTFFPIIPFNPWDETFNSNTKDPWNGFDIFEGMFDGMFKPKPIEIPDSIEKPSVSSNPFSPPNVPPGTFPGFGNPTASNPFEVKPPTASNPFEVKPPTVSNPFEVKPPTVSNPFDINAPTVSNPFDVNIPVVSNPFER